MQIAIDKLEKLLPEIAAYFKNTDQKTLAHKVSEEQWSKKEILGHLVDSSIHNLVRFTEINYAAKPYIYRSYNQNDLVKINQYQSMDSDELVLLWVSINRQIVRLFKWVDEKALDYEIKLTDGSTVNLRFLMNDYVAHLEHHIHQIRNN